jgi:hypothetical protein
VVFTSLKSQQAGPRLLKRQLLEEGEGRVRAVAGPRREQGQHWDEQ